MPSRALLWTSTPSPTSTSCSHGLTFHIYFGVVFLSEAGLQCTDLTSRETLKEKKRKGHVLRLETEDFQSWVDTNRAFWQKCPSSCTEVYWASSLTPPCDRRRLVLTYLPPAEPLYEVLRLIFFVRHQCIQKRPCTTPAVTGTADLEIWLQAYAFPAAMASWTWSRYNAVLLTPSQIALRYPSDPRLTLFGWQCSRGPQQQTDHWLLQQSPQSSEREGEEEVYHKA